MTSTEVIEEIRQWQNVSTWAAVFNRYAEWRSELEIRRVARLEGDAATANESKQVAAIHLEAAKEYENRLQAIKDHLRTHAPQLLHIVPGIDLKENPPADPQPLVCAMLKLEGELLTLLATKPPDESAGNTTPDDGDAVARMLATMDDSQIRIIAIVDDAGLSVDDKLRAISEIDRAYFGWKSPELANLVKKSEQAVRACKWWTIDREQALRDD